MSTSGCSTAMSPPPRTAVRLAAAPDLRAPSWHPSGLLACPRTLAGRAAPARSRPRGCILVLCWPWLRCRVRRRHELDWRQTRREGLVAWCPVASLIEPKITMRQNRYMCIGQAAWLRSLSGDQTPIYRNLGPPLRSMAGRSSSVDVCAGQTVRFGQQSILPR